jgi:hypothetical protein
MANEKEELEKEVETLKMELLIKSKEPKEVIRSEDRSEKLTTEQLLKEL